MSGVGSLEHDALREAFQLLGPDSSHTVSAHTVLQALSTTTTTTTAQSLASRLSGERLSYDEFVDWVSARPALSADQVRALSDSLGLGLTEDDVLSLFSGSVC